MASLNFRLPAIRIDSSAARNPSLLRASPRPSTASNAPRRRIMNAEDAALIALRRLGAAAASEAAAAHPCGDDENASSSWFDSTWELSQGLDICEGPPDDLELNGWLQIYLARNTTAHAVVSGAATAA